MLSEKVLKIRSWKCIKILKYLPIKQSYKSLFSSNLLLSILIPLYAILGFELLKIIGFENNKPPTHRCNPQGKSTQRYFKLKGLNKNLLHHQT